MGIDVITKRIETAVPPLEEGQARYVVASNGIFLERRNALFSTSCRVNCYPAGLKAHDEGCVLHCERIPSNLTRIMAGFFHHAFEVHGGEAVLLLLYHPQRRRFAWHCPEQTVDLIETWTGSWFASSNIRYTDPLELPPGFILFGDAHSHADLPAFTSHTDLQDEHYKDGLHIIAGRVNQRRIDIHVDFVMDQRRFEINPRDIFEEPDLRPSRDSPKGWKKKVRIRKLPYRSYYNA